MKLLGKAIGAVADLSCFQLFMIWSIISTCTLEVFSIYSRGGSGIMSERVSGEIRDRLADRLAQLTPEQRAMVRTVMRERIADELRERLADRIADGLSQLSPEQKDALRTALKQRIAAQVREGLSDRLANQLSDGHGD